MNFRRIYSASALAFAIGVMCSGSTFAADYQFGYRAYGEPSIKPLQVFDDGVRTYFQWPSRLRELPAILAVSDGQSKLATPIQHGPYWVVEGVSLGYQIRLGSLDAEVRRIGVSSLGSTTPSATAKPPAAYGPVAPVAGDQAAAQVVSESSHSFQVPFENDKALLTPAARRVIAQAAQMASSGDAFVRVIGRDDEMYGEGVARARAMVIRDHLVRAGVSVSAIAVAEGEPKAPSGGRQFVSDIVVTQSRRVVQSAPAIPAARAGFEVAVRQALTQVEGAFKSFVSLGVMDQSFSDTLMTQIRAYVLRTPKEETRPVARESARAWEIQPGRMLKDGITQWGKTAGVDVQWHADTDYPINERISVSGSFKDAVGQTLLLTQAAPVPLTWRLEANTLVVSKGEARTR